MYASIDKLTKLAGELDLVQLTDRADPPTGEVDEAVVTEALQAASNIIDGYVGVPYALPLTTVPPVLADLTCDIARFRLYREAPPEEVRKRYEEAIKSLDKISKGTIKLPLPANPGSTGGEPAGRGGMVQIESEARQFSRSKLRGY